MSRELKRVPSSVLGNTKNQFKNDILARDAYEGQVTRKHIEKDT